MHALPCNRWVADPWDDSALKRGKADHGQKEQSATSSSCPMDVEISIRTSNDCRVLLDAETTKRRPHIAPELPDFHLYLKSARTATLSHGLGIHLDKRQ